MQTGRGMQSIQIWFQATECWWKGKECCLKETSPDRPWDGLWKIQNCYRRRSSTRPVSQKKLPDNFVCSCSDVGRQRWCQHLTKCFWGCEYTWHWVSHCDDDATISNKNENLNSLQASSLRQVTSKQDAGARCRERKWELFVSPTTHSFTAHSHVCLPLEMERLLSVHNISW